MQGRGRPVYPPLGLPACPLPLRGLVHSVLYLVTLHSSFSDQKGPVLVNAILGLQHQMRLPSSVCITCSAPRPAVQCTLDHAEPDLPNLPSSASLVSQVSSKSW